VGELNINPWAEVLEQDESVGCFRLGESSPNLAWGYQSHWVVKQGHVFGIWFDPWAKTNVKGDPIVGRGPHYVWCQRPALYHPRFFEIYGRFKEGITAITLDWEHNKHVAETSGPKIFLALLNPWRHIESVELAGVTP
jgi:hypothetical protein